MSRPARAHVTTEGPGLAAVRMGDQEGKNALSEPFVAELQAALRGVSADRTVHAVLLLGLPEVFCSGAPLELLRRLAAGGIDPNDLLLPRAVLDVPVPVIAAMEGHATGGGLALGCCADIILVARESRYGATFVNMGITPGMGSTRLLEYVLSPAVAHELLMTGELRRGADFERCGGFNHILPRAEVLPKALELGARSAEKPRPALECLKRVLSAPRRQAFEAARTAEALMHAVCFGQPDLARRIEEGYVD